MLDELCVSLFASLTRSDQRRSGMSYLRGLLLATGRKSMRNVAAAVDAPATEQSMHHFISDSTWDWEPVRAALTDYLLAAAPPRAWVLRPLVIPKAGNDSVGVGKRFFPSMGQALNAQHAIGVWAASEDTSSPVNWRLHLPHAWLDDKRKRRRASIPAGTAQETMTDCLLAAYLEVVSRQGVPARPVVFDARCLDVPAVVRTLRAAGLPWLIRIGSNLRLSTAERGFPGRDRATVPAYQVVAAARTARRLVNWVDHEPVHTTRTDLAAAVPARLPGGAEPDLRVVGTGQVGQSWPAQLWLTDIGAPAATLLRLSKLVERVDRDALDIAENVGMRDFSGRSFAGWHRHVTLASAAHAVVASTSQGLGGNTSLSAIS
ncbi:putative ISXo8 transposase [Actinokineospora sp. NBRC 105648]|nr:putative ISXo8 transposase [Actinokineospora sp. NBRC 105648]